MDIKEVISGLLSDFDISAEHIGTLQLIRAMEILADSPAEIHAVRKGIYMVIADEYDCSWKAIESNLRRLIDQVWVQDPERLSVLAGHPLIKKPSVAQFLQIFSRYLLWKSHSPGR